MPTDAPSAPGKVPKRLSKLRFSLMMNTTCLIGVVVLKEAASTRVGRSEGDEERTGAVRSVPLGFPLANEQATAASRTTAARATARMVRARDGVMNWPCDRERLSRPG